jgi:hypothetical protein
VFNLMRNTGGSIGIAAMTTMLSRGSQIHQAALVHNVNPYDPEVQQRVQQLTHTLPGGGAQQAYGIFTGWCPAVDGVVLHRQLSHAGVSLFALRSRGVSVQTCARETGRRADALSWVYLNPRSLLDGLRCRRAPTLDFEPPKIILSQP